MCLKRINSRTRDRFLLHLYLCTNQWAMRLLRGGFTCHKLHELHNYTTQIKICTVQLNRLLQKQLKSHFLNFLGVAKNDFRVVGNTETWLIVRYYMVLQLGKSMSVFILI